MAIRLTKLPKTQYSGLDYQNIIEDIIALVTENPEFNEQYDDFLSSNAGRLLTEVFAYITDQLATRIDWAVNENFIGTATQKSSVIKILKLLGYSFNLPESSRVDVSITFKRPVGTFILTEEYDNSGSINPFSLTAEDKNGDIKNFEVVPYSGDKFEYKLGKSLETGTAENSNLTHIVSFYEGTTYIENFEAETDNNPIFILSQSPIIENSIRVYLVQEEEGSFLETELEEVNSFLDIKSQSEDYELTFKKNVEENDTITIEFPSVNLVPNSERRLQAGEKIRVFYRVGGGINGNIIARSINTTKNFLINGEKVEVSFINYQSGSGGMDGETIEHATAYAPLSIRTAQKVVTEEDYNIIINSFNNVLKSKSFGNNNSTASEIYEQFGVYIHPLEVWNFILTKKSGWEDLLPSEYQYFKWNDLRLENRFNSLYSFKDGDFDYEATVFSNNIIYSINDGTADLTMDINGDGVDEEFYNYFLITTPTKFKNNIYVDDLINSDFKCKITNQELGDNFFFQLNNLNEFIEVNTTNNSLLEGSTPTWKIIEDIASFIVSDINIIDGVDFSNDNILDLNFDNRGIINIDVEDGDGDTEDIVTASNIVDNINSGTSGFTNDSSYNNGSSGTKGSRNLLDANVADLSASIISADDTYYVYVNGKEYGLELETGDSYEDVINALQEKLNFTITGDLIINNTVVSNINESDIRKIYKGMAISGTGVGGVPGEAVVSSVSIPDKTITLSFASSQTISSNLLTLSGYIVSGIDTGGGNWNISILNIGAFPKYSILVESGDTGTDLFSANGLNTTLPVPDTDSGVIGYQNVGLDVTLGDTTPLVNSTAYYFIINGHEYNVTTGTDWTYTELIADLNLIDSFNSNYEAISDTNDIRFQTLESGPVLLKAGVSGDDLFEGLLGADYSLSTPVGGGDYSDVASLVTYNGDAAYLKLESPCTGEVSSILFTGSSTAEHNGSEKLFGLSTEGTNSYLMRGQRTATIITDITNTYFGDIIIENGTINFYRPIRKLYLNYLIDDSSQIRLGTYENENYDEGNARYRELGKRIYNTVYDSSTNEIDFNNSDFYLKFTKNKTIEGSIYVIDNDWDLQESLSARVESTSISSFDSSNFNLNLNIDDKGDVQFDITGDSGAAGSYTIAELINNINVELTTAYSLEGVLYSTFPYAIENSTGDGIIIRSPIKTSDSSVVLKQATANDCVNEMFGLTEGSDYTYGPTGDYYLTYDDTEDIMIINKLSDNVPDLPFYIHFIYDKKFIENIFEEFPEGTLDEDIYENLLYPYKITGINHIYKNPIFDTFDIKANIYYNKIYSESDVSSRVENKLQEHFVLDNLDFGQHITKSKVMSLIHEEQGVEYVVITFFGRDAQDVSTNEESVIEAKFNEIILLSENQYFAGIKIHGLLFNYYLSE
jgi:hypothetical protein